MDSIATTHFLWCFLNNSLTARTCEPKQRCMEESAALSAASHPVPWLQQSRGRSLQSSLLVQTCPMLDTHMEKSVVFTRENHNLCLCDAKPGELLIVFLYALCIARAAHRARPLQLPLTFRDLRLSRQLGRLHFCLRLWQLLCNYREAS